jgi:LysR family glycine cleavage system transcriptional activator
MRQMLVLGAVLSGVMRLARKAWFLYRALVFLMFRGLALARRLPSLNALKAFEAAARHESFTKAAQELCVTQGAVSHQVKALEAELGLRLFNREHHRLIITEAGQAYLVVVRDAFDRLALGTEHLLQRQNAGVLTVSTSPNFASKWLVHRLGRFAEQHPAIDLRVAASLQHIDFAREDFDLAIRHGDGNWPGLHVTRLCAETLFPVCSPALVRGRRALRSPADLRRHTLLHINERRDWANWLEAADVKDFDVTRGPVFNQASMALDAAVDGQGIALARSALAAWDLIAGRLVRPFGLSLEVPYAYWIVCPKAAAALPKVSAFREWLLAEAAADSRRMRPQLNAASGRRGQRP